MLDFLKQLGKAVTDGMGMNVRSDPAPVGGAGGTAVIPDKPVPFGYKNSWLCIKSNSPEEVIEKIGLKNPRVSTWNDGVNGSSGGVFVSPVLDGYVLVIGWEGDILDTDPARLDELAGKFPELQFFSTHRISEYHVWAKYVDGKPVRVYGFNGGDGVLVANRGVPTPEEVALHCDDFPVDNDIDFDVAILPDEECVMLISAAWGIDTLFRRKTFPESTGYLCTVN